MSEPLTPPFSRETTGALESALRVYLADVSNHVRGHVRPRPSQKLRRLKVAGGENAIHERFAECETLESWRKLVLAWDPLLQESDWIFDADRQARGLQGLLATWFRRSGLYAEIANGKVPSAAGYARRLIEDTCRVARERPLVRILAVSSLHLYDDAKEHRFDDTGLGFPVAICFPKGRFDLPDFELWSQPEIPELERLLACSADALFSPAAAELLKGLARDFATPAWVTRQVRPVEGVSYSKWRKEVAHGDPLWEPPKKERQK